MNFDDAFALLVPEEGGYSNPAPGVDPGGETNFGISKRSYPDEDIKNLTRERAKAIYEADFWLKAQCDIVPEWIKFDLFDTAVNSGPHQAVVLLQRAAFADADGVIGPHTLMGMGYMTPDKLRRRFNGLRLQLMEGLHNWPPNSRGWALRVANNLLRD